MCDEQIDSQEELLLPPLSGQADNQPLIFFAPLELSTDNLAECGTFQYDENEFLKGLKESSFIAGFYTGLLNAGMSAEDAMNYIFGKMNSDMNLEINKIQANASIEASMNSSITLEKNQL